MRRKLNVLCLSVLLITGLALIGWSIVAQDEEIQQDMEEYAALVEQVQVSEETEIGDEYEVQELLPVPDTGNENTEAAETGQEQPTAAPDYVSETLEIAAEAASRQDSGETPVDERQTDQGTIIIMIPGDDSGTVQGGMNQTDDEQREQSTAQHVGREQQETKPPKALETEKFNLIITDFEMPEMDGITFLKKLKSDKKYYDIPVIMMSSVFNSEKRASAISLGACEYISKLDFNQEIFQNLIKKIAFLYLTKYRLYDILN